MKLFYRNNKSSNSMQQQAIEKSPLVPVVCRYPQRATRKEGVPTRLVFVQSTAHPDHRFASFLAWVLHIHNLNGKSFYFKLRNNEEEV
ncbi:MAG: hypothetical protein EOO20_22390 [Chryseobacterium sp.]|nr:MAG: hypothetical protein EOO20_22390 [Chryseobacterium sp.]